MMNEEAIEVVAAKLRSPSTFPGETATKIARELISAYLSALPQQEPVAWIGQYDLNEVKEGRIGNVFPKGTLSPGNENPLFFASPISSPSEVESKKPLDRQWSGWVYDADHSMSDGGDTRMTAAEEVLAYLLVEIVGSPDDVQYSPNDAQRILEDRLKEGRRLETSYAELLDQRRTTRAEAAEAKLSLDSGESLKYDTALATVSDHNAAFDPADDAFGGAFKDGFREGWLFAKDPGFENRQELEEDYPREVDIAPSECWDAYRSHYFAMLPLAAIPEVGSALTRAAEAGFGGEK